MLTLEEMKHRKQVMGLSCEEISKRSGVPLGTVQKVFSGITQTPRHNTLVALSAAFSSSDVSDVIEGASAPAASEAYGRPTSDRYGGANSNLFGRADSDRFGEADSGRFGGTDSDRFGESDPDRFGGTDSDRAAKRGSAAYSPGTASDIDMVRDVGVVYTTSGSSALAGSTGNSGDRDVDIRAVHIAHKDCRCPDDPVMTNVHYYDRQGTYTLQDYLALPDDRRVELIDGVIYDMSAPYAGHQVISGQLTHLFNSFIDEHGGPCEVYAAPTDVQLDCDNKTIVEPDVFIVCKPSKVTLQRIYGAPDLAIEILSKSTRRKDMTLKLWKYSNAGVREYWIVDPKKQCVTVYDFAHDPDLQDAKTYSFHDKIPVGIYDGALVIDFERIWKKIARFYPGQTTAN